MKLRKIIISLEIIAVAISGVYLVWLIVLFTDLNRSAGIAFGILVVASVVMNIASRKKGIIFASPGFLAALGLTIVFFVNVYRVCPEPVGYLAPIFLLLSLLIKLFTIRDRNTAKGLNIGESQPAAGAYRLEDKAKSQR